MKGGLWFDGIIALRGKGREEVRDKTVGRDRERERERI